MVRRADVTGGDGVRLVAWEFSEPPKAVGAETGEAPLPGLLLLHGLMGRAAHWAEVARRLSGRYRVVGLDQRGHGWSEDPGPGGYDRDAFVTDAEAALEQLGLAPAVVVGHAMGALTAWQLAARRPDLVRAVVIGDMRASALGEPSQHAWARWYASWPVPFDTLADVRRWFGAEDPALERPSPARGEYYAEVVTERADGWCPVFVPDRMLEARESWVHDAHWEELARVACPALVLRGVDGELGRAEAQEMVRVLPHGHYADLPEAGHLAHYEHPETWSGLVEEFLGATLPAE